MTAINSLSSRIVAASTALMLSLVLFSNTVTLPVQTTSQAFASAYVGAVA